MLILAITFAIAQIPGITAKDVYPRACVDCHTGKANMPATLSADLKTWADKVDPRLLAKSQASAPKGMTLKGKHPNVAAMVKSTPVDCLKCHGKASKMAPPFATMMHAIHLTGGEQNPFLAKFDGACSHCHKLDAKSGQWSLPSAAEK
jgi:mono/diheme cytochrome c family protein